MKNQRDKNRLCYETFRKTIFTLQIKHLCDLALISIQDIVIF